MKSKNILIVFTFTVIIIWVFNLIEIEAALAKNNKYALERGIPVLLYHSVSNREGKLFMPPEKFERQMKYLKDTGYITLTAEEALALFNGGLPVPEKAVLITFDDGYSDNYANAFPILKEYGFKATIFVIASSVDRDPDKLTGAQIKDMAENGVSFGSHTANHDDLSVLPYDEQRSSLEASKKQIENLTGRKVYCLAYPFGKYNRMTFQAAEAAGYQMAFTVNHGFAYKSNGIFTLKRIRIDGTDSLSAFKFNLNFKNHKNHEK